MDETHVPADHDSEEIDSDSVGGKSHTWLYVLLVISLFVNVVGAQLLLSEIDSLRWENMIQKQRIELLQDHIEIQSSIVKHIMADSWDHAARDFFLDRSIFREPCGLSDYEALYADGKAYCFRGNYDMKSLPSIMKASRITGIGVVTGPATYDQKGKRSVWIEDSVHDLSNFWRIMERFEP